MKRACLVYLASPRERRAGNALRLDALRASLRSVESCLRPALPDLDVLVFHEDFTHEDKVSLEEIAPCRFHSVDFSWGADRYVNFGAPRGYQLMCRFWSGMVQRHEALQDYSHYIRLDDDSYFIRPKVTRAAVDRMLAHDYSYRQLFVSTANQCDTFFEFTRDFLKQEGLSTQTLDEYLAVDGKYLGKSIYNNFHCASLRLWRHPIVERYVDAIEAENGWLGKGWFDDGVHAMIVVGIAPQIGMTSQAETSFGYRHNAHCAEIGDLSVVVDPALPFIAEEHEYL